MRRTLWVGITTVLSLLLLSVAVSAFSTRHLACADKWFPVCTGMTAGSVAAVC